MAKTEACMTLILIVLCAQAVAEQAPSRPASESAGGVTWSQSYEVGTKVAAMEKSPVLLFFTAAWCPWCRKLEREVLAEPKISSELRKFVCVKLDVDKNPGVAMAYGVVSMPRIIIINTQGEIIGDWLGYRTADEFLQLLADIRPYVSSAAGTKKAPQIGASIKGPADANQPRQVSPQSPAQPIDPLGHKDPKIRQNAMSSLLKSGSAGVPAMLDGLENDYLGVRIAAWKIIRTLCKTDLPYDPWGPRSQRAEEVKRLRGELTTTPSSPPPGPSEPGP